MNTIYISCSPPGADLGIAEGRGFRQCADFPQKILKSIDALIVCVRFQANPDDHLCINEVNLHKFYRQGNYFEKLDAQRRFPAISEAEVGKFCRKNLRSDKKQFSRATKGLSQDGDEIFGLS
jgi:hypothetical protein